MEIGKCGNMEIGKYGNRYVTHSQTESQRLSKLPSLPKTQ